MSIVVADRFALATGAFCEQFYGEIMEAVEIAIGIAVVLFCLTASSILVFYSRRQINRISRMNKSTYRDIIQERNG